MKIETREWGDAYVDYTEFRVVSEDGRTIYKLALETSCFTNEDIEGIKKMVFAAYNLGKER